MGFLDFSDRHKPKMAFKTSRVTFAADKVTVDAFRLAALLFAQTAHTNLLVRIQ